MQTIFEPLYCSKRIFGDPFWKQHCTCQWFFSQLTYVSKSHCEFGSITIHTFWVKIFLLFGWKFPCGETVTTRKQGSTNCSILPSRMGEHDVSWENVENTGGHREDGKHGKHQPCDLKHFTCDSKRAICQLYDSKPSILQHLWRQLKTHNIRARRTWSWVGS